MCSLGTVILPLKYDINLSTSIQYHYKHMHTCISHFNCVQLFVTPMDCSPPGSLVHGDSPGKNTGVGCHTLPRDLPSPGIASTSLMSPALKGGSLPLATWEAPTLAQIPSFLIHIIVPTPTLLPGLPPSHHSPKFQWVWSFQEINLGNSFHWLLPKYPSTTSKFLFLSEASSLHHFSKWTSIFSIPKVFHFTVMMFIMNVSWWLSPPVSLFMSFLTCFKCTLHLLFPLAFDFLSKTQV